MAKRRKARSKAREAAAPAAPSEEHVPATAPVRVEAESPLLAHEKTLALAGAGLLALGVGVVYDVFAETEHPLAWAPIVLGLLLLLGSIAISGLVREPALDIVGEAPTGGRHKLWIAIGVVAALAFQAIVPLRYYLGDDAYDERFSWRMFSAVRMQRCQLEALETRQGAEAPVPLMSTIHVAWVTTMERNREAVVDRYLHWRCEQGAQEARVVNRCVSTSGVTLSPLETAIDCSSRTITSTGGEAP